MVIPHWQSLVSIAPSPFRIPDDIRPCQYSNPLPEPAQIPLSKQLTIHPTLLAFSATLLALRTHTTHLSCHTLFEYILQSPQAAGKTPSIFSEVVSSTVDMPCLDSLPPSFLPSMLILPRTRSIIILFFHKCNVTR